MEDFQFILYILAAVAYFLFTTWRKAFKGADENDVPEQVERRRPRPEPGHENRPVPPPAQRPVQPMQPRTSFEDILRELQPKAERAQTRGQEVYERANERTTDAYSKAKGHQEQSLPEPVPAVETVDRMRPRVLSWEKSADAIEAAKRSGEMRRRLFKEEEKSKETIPVNRYAELLRNPAGARDAVILSEIFKRKF